MHQLQRPDRSFLRSRSGLILAREVWAATGWVGVRLGSRVGGVLFGPGVRVWPATGWVGVRLGSRVGDPEFGPGVRVWPATGWLVYVWALEWGEFCLGREFGFARFVFEAVTWEFELDRGRESGWARSVFEEETQTSNPTRTPTCLEPT